jgi:protein-tyrosine phosphatase
LRFGSLRRRNVEHVIDLHCHVLPDIDDGPTTIEESLQLARAAQADGASTLVATPHVSPRYPNDADTIAMLVAELNGRLDDEGVRVSMGAEIAAMRVPEMSPEDLARLGLGGGRWLLIEPPLTSTPAGLDLVVADLHRRDHRVLLAHPERCSGFHRDPRRLESLVDAGALTSLTAGSFRGRFGAKVRRFAWMLLDAGMVHNVASDFHDRAGRPPGMTEALDQPRLRELSDWLTCEVPAAILGDREIPPRPAIAEPAIDGQRQQRWWLWWRRSARF